MAVDQLQPTIIRIFIGYVAAGNGESKHLAQFGPYDSPSLLERRSYVVDRMFLRYLVSTIVHILKRSNTEDSGC